MARAIGGARCPCSRLRPEKIDHDVLVQGLIPVARADLARCRTHSRRRGLRESCGMILVLVKRMIDLFVGPAEGAEMPGARRRRGFRSCRHRPRPAGGGRVLPRGISRDRFARCWRRTPRSRGVDDRFWFVPIGCRRSRWSDRLTRQPRLCFSRRVTAKPGRATVA